MVPPRAGPTRPRPASKRCLRTTTSSSWPSPASGQWPRLSSATFKACPSRRKVRRIHPSLTEISVDVVACYHPSGLTKLCFDQKLCTYLTHIRLLPFDETMHVVNLLSWCFHSTENSLNLTTAWPDWAKCCHFCKNIQVFGNFLTVYF